MSDVTRDPTEYELIDLLPIVQGQGWRIRRDGAIRNRAGACPLCALGRVVAGESKYRSKIRPMVYRGDVFGDAYYLAIILAADGDVDGEYLSHVRQRLLVALGLEVA